MLANGFILLTKTNTIMNKKKLLLRMCVSPAILLLLIITFSFELIKRFIGYIRWGGEFIIMNKDDRKYIDDIFKLLKEELLNKDF